MTQTATEISVIAILTKQLGPIFSGKPDPLTADLVSDLHMESLDLVEFIMESEDQFAIQITDAEADAFADDANSTGKTVRDFCQLVDGKLAEKAVAE